MKTIVEDNITNTMNLLPNTKVVKHFAKFTSEMFKKNKI